jgi:hypothetical protein
MGYSSKGPTYPQTPVLGELTIQNTKHQIPQDGNEFDFLRIHQNWYDKATRSRNH